MGGLPLILVAPTEGQKVIRYYYRDPGPSLEKMLKYMEMVVFDASVVSEDRVEDRYRMSLASPQQEAGGDAESVWDVLRQVAAPTQVLWGRDNRLQGYDNALLMLKPDP